MDGLCRSTRLLSSTRLSSKQANKSIRNFSVSAYPQRCDGQTPPTRRPTALPKGSRDAASRLRYQSSRECASQKHFQFRDSSNASNPVPARDRGSRDATQEEWMTRASPDGIPDMNLEYFKIGDIPGGFHPVFLRDACTCPRCVDPSSTQKQFQTTDIPRTIKADSVITASNGYVTIKWENDIPGFGPDHISTYPAKFFEIASSKSSRRADRSDNTRPRLWNQGRIEEEFQFVEFNDYMKDDTQLYRALALLNSHGLLLLRNVPDSEESVADIAGRMGTIRDTFYGRTWDVKSVPEAKNVAYTHQFLGLHMDLLYMTNPPGIQLLHCLKNTCKGGASLFSDSFYAASRLPEHDLQTLSTTNLAYHYRNAGEHYYYERPVLELGRDVVQLRDRSMPVINFVNYSPPFQAAFPISKNSQGYVFPKVAKALRNFADRVESPRNLFEYRLKVGECVIFNNRRVLHGRRNFQPGKGERWLKGTYVDTDVFRSKWRTLNEKYNDMKDFTTGAQYVNPGKLEAGQAFRAANFENQLGLADAKAVASS